MKKGDKVEIKNITSDLRAFKNSIIQELWTGIITGKKYAVLKNTKGQVVKNVEVSNLKLLS